MNDKTIIKSIDVTPIYEGDQLAGVGVSLATQRIVTMEDGAEIAAPPHRQAFELDASEIAELMPAVSAAAARSGATLPDLGPTLDLSRLTEAERAKYGALRAKALGV